MTEKPFSQSCENNKDAILSILKIKLVKTQRLLEIGSGTGQHAVYFSKNLANVIWQTSDRKQNHSAIMAWMEGCQNQNLLMPLTLDVSVDSDWPKQKFDAVFSANTTHIMGWEVVTKMFHGVANSLSKGGSFLLYGPFNKGGKFSAESNRSFDQWLKQQGAEMGIRDIKDLTVIADKLNLELVDEIKMPANNLILHWQKVS